MGVTDFFLWISFGISFGTSFGISFESLFFTGRIHLSYPFHFRPAEPDQRPGRTRADPSPLPEPAAASNAATQPCKPSQDAQGQRREAQLRSFRLNFEPSGTEPPFCSRRGAGYLRLSRPQFFFISLSLSRCVAYLCDFIWKISLFVNPNPVTSELSFGLIPFVLRSHRKLVCTSIVGG
jgi:hypothetical protein